tara:strand:- start:268 stop:771 length:504 start_codon:yes stop_codon:yes gene_type:complete
MQYGLKGDYHNVQPGYSTYTSNDGSFLGYDYSLLNVFKNRKGSIKLGTLFSIDNIETNKVSNHPDLPPNTEISPFSPYYKGHAIYWQIEYAFLNTLNFWMRSYLDNNSENDNLASYLTPGFSLGLSLKLNDKYFIGYDFSRYSINTNDGFIRFDYFLIQSISLGYQF